MEVGRPASAESPQTPVMLGAPGHRTWLLPPQRSHEGQRAPEQGRKLPERSHHLLFMHRPAAGLRVPPWTPDGPSRARRFGSKPRWSRARGGSRAASLCSCARWGRNGSLWRPPPPHRGSGGLRPAGVSGICLGPALRRMARPCLCLCVCVFSLGDAALTVAAGQHPRSDTGWPRPLGPHARTSPLARCLSVVVGGQGLGRGWPVSRAPEAGRATSDRLCHSGSEGHLGL